jgi:hypothetical protein
MMSLISIINSLLSDTKKFKRLVLVLIILMSTVVIILIVLLLFQSKTKSNLKIDFTKTGATIIVDNATPIAAQFLLPGSSRWTNTGIEFQPGSEIEITASGKINLAVKALVEAAGEDQRPALAWCSPSGIDYTNPKIKNQNRMKYLIKDDARMGMIIGYFLTKDEGKSEPSIQNARPKGMFVINEKTTITTPLKSSTLWLTINDILLDQNDLTGSKEAFYGPAKELKPKQQRHRDERWEYIIRNNYWDLWFEDNIGYYLIQIKEKDR